MKPTTALMTFALLLASTGLTSTPLAAQEQVWERATVAPSGGWFGFSFMVDVDEDSPRTVRVLSVEPNSGAARGGLEHGDTIIRWNDRTDVNAAIQAQRAEVGDTVRVRVRRDGRERSLTLVAGPRPAQRFTRVVPRAGRSVLVPERSGEITILDLDSLRVHADTLQSRLRIMLRDSLAPQLREMQRVVELETSRMMPHIREMQAATGALRIQVDSAGRAVSIFAPRGVAGAELTDLNPELAGYFQASEGVLVLRVVPETPAARAGLRAGDVITSINGRSVNRVRDVSRAVADDSNRRVELAITRKGRAQTLRMSWE